jgi:GTP-binding protein
VVVVAGRPNVGKSTLVNRFIGRRAAVVEERPGVTRDRLELEAEWNGRAFLLVDTGGWLGGGSSLEAKVAQQARRAIEAADLVLVVVDVTVGVTTEDEDLARLVKRADVPAMLVANKVDNPAREVEAWELVSLGLGDPHLVSALHGRRTGDLLDELVRRLGPATEQQVEKAPAAKGQACPRVAIVGRPNVGKSTLFNRLVGEERSVVHDVPGTTRDAIDTVLDTSEGPIRFVDTAGMKRRSRSAVGTEYFAMVRALQALDAADVVLLVIDASEGVTHQDQRLAERIGASGSPVVVVLNKWELLATEARSTVLVDVGDRLAFLGESPVLKVSALSGLGVHRILGALGQAVDAYHRRVPTGELNRVLAAIQAAHAAPGSRIRYAVQGAIDPPTFTLFATHRLPATYLRYVERRLREVLDLGPTPLKLRVRLGG